MGLRAVSFQFLLGTTYLLCTTVSLWAKGNIDRCASYENLFKQVSCYAAAAKTKNDLAPCKKAAHDGVRYQCYAIFAEHSASPDVCHQIPSTSNEHRSLIDVCLSDVALKTQDQNVCNDILTPGIRDSCYFKIAKDLGNLALCEKIADEGLLSLCAGKPVIVD